MARSGKKRLLVIDDEPEVLNLVKEILGAEGNDVTTVDNSGAFLDAIKSQTFDGIVSDVYMPDLSGIELRKKAIELGSHLPWIYITGNPDPSLMEKAVSLGVTDVILKPFEPSELIQTVQNIHQQKKDTLHEITEVVAKISGVQLKKDRRLFIESRLMRRSRDLGLSSVDDYLEHFNKNRTSEIEAIISVLTTHTTSFFRESDHFDYLFDEVFPKWMETPEIPRTIWSAACSTGPEIYSLIISWLEFCASRPASPAPEVKFIGTDIDWAAVKTARKAIYPVDELARISPRLITKYFDRGSGEISNLVRFKGKYLNLAKFDQLNLQAENFPYDHVDIIFCRNVFIYFSKEAIAKIADRFNHALNKDGRVFIGHSETMQGISDKFTRISNAVYARKIDLEDNPIEHKFSRKTVAKSEDSPDEVDTSPSITNSASSESRKGPIKVVIVDDSMTIRVVLKKFFGDLDGYEVIGDFSNPKRLTREVLDQADVMTLDIEMPEMDGMTYAKSVLNDQNHPPIIIISGLKREDAHDLLALESQGGIFAYIEKPKDQNDTETFDTIKATVKSAAKSESSNTKKLYKPKSTKETSRIIYAGDQDHDLILIGASTGGVEALEVILKKFPVNGPPVLITQHIPANFSTAFAKRLNQSCNITVVEGEDGDEVKPGHAYIAPGGLQMGAIKKSTGKLQLEVIEGPKVNRFAPSVDYLYSAILPYSKNFNVVAGLMTGMGRDGAAEMLNLKTAGCFTVCQDEESSVVWGMPGSAVSMNAHCAIASLDSFAFVLFEGLKSKSKKKPAA